MLWFNLDMNDPVLQKPLQCCIKGGDPDCGGMISYNYFSRRAGYRF